MMEGVDKRLVCGGIEISISYMEIKHRVYNYLSQVAVRLASDGAGFRKVALTEDEDATTFGVSWNDVLRVVSEDGRGVYGEEDQEVLYRDGRSYSVGGLIDEALVGLSERLRAFGCYGESHADREEVTVVLSRVPQYPITEVWERGFKQRVVDYIVSVCIGGWMELMGIREGFRGYSEAALGDKLDFIRGLVDTLYLRSYRYPIRNMGF